MSNPYVLPIAFGGNFAEVSGRCPGYVVDHIKALRRAGAHDPSNTQWQRVEDAKVKDRWED